MPMSSHTSPIVYIIPAHLSTDELHEFEDKLLDLHVPMTYDAREAALYLAKISQKKRAAFELRSRGVWAEERTKVSSEPPQKRMRLSNFREAGQVREMEDESDLEMRNDVSFAGTRENAESNASTEENRPKRILVLKMEWLDDSVKEHKLQPFEPYVVYDAQVIAKPAGESSPQLAPRRVFNAEGPPKTTSPISDTSPIPLRGAETTILSRAKADTPISTAKGHPSAHQKRRRFGQFLTPGLTHPNKPPKLVRTTTSEFEGADSSSLPEIPQWVKEDGRYACCRDAPLHTINHRFLTELSKIKESRLLTLDEIGVRAYSTSIASIAAYPHLLSSPGEILRLPGCDAKIAALFSEYRESADEEDERYLPAARELEKDEHLQHLKLFWEIWGVGPDTARKFYFDHGWKDLDDVVEYGWSGLNRVQQIGVKYYEEFQTKIPRAEVEEIAAVIHQHARKCVGIPQSDWGERNDMEAIIVGGYRRGKELSGDVDIILSHRDERLTENLVLDVVASLEQEGWITHTLTLNTTTSNRGQQTLPFRGEGHGGHGFDSLDKALCVWQNPHFDASPSATDTTEKKTPTAAKNSNIHRRVDIIVSAWRTVGCAVLGWSGATTFQRDVRRYVKREKGWKFDSSGLRDRATGMVLDLENGKGSDDADTWLDRERRLMEGMGIGWREPGLRCTW